MRYGIEAKMGILRTKCTKLEDLKIALKELNKKHFSDISQRVKQDQEALFMPKIAAR